MELSFSTSGWLILGKVLNTSLKIYLLRSRLVSVETGPNRPGDSHITHTFRVKVREHNKQLTFTFIILV